MDIILSKSVLMQSLSSALYLPTERASIFSKKMMKRKMIYEEDRVQNAEMEQALAKDAELDPDSEKDQPDYA
jgi:hypothetical protein